MLRRCQATWTCLQYHRQAPSFRRYLASAASSVVVDPKSLLQAPESHDDAALRKVFDSHDFWEAFTGQSHGNITRQKVGLFQNHYLTSPEGFRASATATLEKCRSTVARIHAVATLEEYRGLAKDFDRLSDLLCRVIDAADFVRSTHKDRRFQLAASEAHSMMFEYMNTLNTDTRLNDQLKRALTTPEVTQSWSEEELRVAEILRQDFSQSAIDLPMARRKRFVELSNEINEVGSRFLDDMQPSSTHLAFPSARLKGADPMLLKNSTDTRGIARIPVVGSTTSHVLRYVSDEEVRKDVYIASRTASAEQVRRLEKLIRSRAELARTAGFDSFASMTLTDKMARSPEAVTTFLEALVSDLAPALRQELSNLLEFKRRQRLDQGRSGINAWDREYYRARMEERLQRPSRLINSTSAFFSLGTVMQGLSRLFNQLYGIRLVPREPLAGETWSPDVRRLDAVNENGECVAVIYCDLFTRLGKTPNPAHFTVRCSRLISAAEIAEYAFDASLTSDDCASLANDGMSISAPQRDGSVYQLPTIALICDFPAPSTTQPPLLPFPSVVTLFHEMGHAVHTVLGRTKLQNVSGTRCATDFSELPSILMERFARDPAVLGLYARHWETGVPLSAEAASQLGQHTARADGPADTEWQVLLALLDQALHSRASLEEEGWSSDAAAQTVFARYGAVPEPRETRWQGFFGHLVGYGACYYTYLFDRAIARRVWEVVFGGGGPGGHALSRERGEKFRDEVLKWGGGRDPWVCVASVLGDESLVQGGQNAMAEVGRWGLKASRT